MRDAEWVEDAVVVDCGWTFADGQRALIDATLFVPRQLCMPATALVCVPGGTYTRAYYDLGVDGIRDHSFAAWFAARGFVVLALDNLGTGASAAPSSADDASLEAMARAVAETGRQLRRQLLDGTAAANLAALERVELVGVGHSMGGSVLLLAQSSWPTFDRLAVLGTTHLHMAGTAVDDGVDALDEQVASQTELIRAMSGASWEQGYLELPRAGLRGLFHLADVPEEVVRVDDAFATVLPRSAAITCVGSAAAACAASIEVPTLLAYGEVDVSPDPHAELAAYTASDDLTLFVLRGSAHCHNMAQTRARLWERIAAWVDPHREDVRAG